MSEQPNPFVADATAPSPVVDQPSIIDTILDLDAFLSGDVRLAEKTAYIVTRPDLEARLDELDEELSTLVDQFGRPLTPPGERAVGEEQGRTAAVVATEREAVQAEMQASRKGIRLRQLNGDDWQDFRTQWRETLEAGSPFPDDMWDDLVARCAIRPKITIAQMEAMRTKVGSPQMDEIRSVAWHLNRESGVSIPKSSVSSAVLRQQRPEQS